SVTARVIRLPAGCHTPLAGSRVEGARGPRRGRRSAPLQPVYWVNSDTAKAVPAGAAIDWDQNWRIDAVRRRLDLNADGALNGLAGTPDEWSILVFNGGSIGKQIE